MFVVEVKWIKLSGIMLFRYERSKYSVNILWYR